jgi:hypothetical protein
MILLVEPRLDNEGYIQPSGLEKLALAFGVNIGADMVLSIGGMQYLRDPSAAVVMLSREADASLREAIRNQLESRDNFMFRVRSVTPAAAPPAQYDVQPLLQTRPMLQLPDGRFASGQWSETQIKGSPTLLVESLQKNRDEFIKRIGGMPVNVAVTVREKGEAAPPVHPGMPPTNKPGTPRLVVIGDATLACNTQMQTDAEFSYNVLSSSLSWLRGKAVVLGNIKPKERASYRPNLTADELSRLRWVPGTLLLLFVVAAGITVGILRRRGS